MSIFDTVLSYQDLVMSLCADADVPLTAGQLYRLPWHFDPDDNRALWQRAGLRLVRVGTFELTAAQRLHPSPRHLAYGCWLVVPVGPLPQPEGTSEWSTTLPPSRLALED